jgi:glycosyltransferase involved in cell wall biosynthesis
MELFMIVWQNPIRVFVHLAYGFGAESWNRKYESGELIGFNEPFAYGYHRAEKHGCSVEYSKDAAENGASRLFRLGLRAILKFDVVHAWRNRKGIFGADVVWTHTESQNLAILLLFALLQPNPRPKLIAQVTWIFDRWHKFTWLHRWLFRKLLSQTDVLTLHSPENFQVARTLLPNVRVELVKMGIRDDMLTTPRLRPCHRPIRLISLGNDEHRDWETLIRAVKGLDNCELQIASQKVDRKLLAEARNISVAQIKTNRDLLRLYEWADFVVIALKPNLHASGITVLEEAALSGVPTICTDTGGLSALYFAKDEIRYVSPPQDVAALSRAIIEFAQSDGARYAQAIRAQAKMGEDGLSSEAFVKRHVELSKEMLSETEQQEIDRGKRSGWISFWPRRKAPRPVYGSALRRSQAP